MTYILMLWLFAAESPAGTTIPPATEIVDAAGDVWALINGPARPGCDPVTELCTLPTEFLLYCKDGRVYGQHINGNWYRGAVGRGWTLVGPNRPC